MFHELTKKTKAARKLCSLLRNGFILNRMTSKRLSSHKVLFSVNDLFPSFIESYQFKIQIK